MERICFGLIFLLFSHLVRAEQEPWRRPLKAGEIRHTQISLNYRIQTLYDQGEPGKSWILDRYTFEPVENPDLVSQEDVIEERWEDPENLQVLRYDFDGSLKSQRFFKKDGELRGEVYLDEARIEALENYDVEDEELPLMPIDWDAIIFADENFTRDRIVRWSETRDFRIKTEYTIQGFIHTRTAWNRHTGEKLDLSGRIYSQPVSRDIVQNWRGFLEIHYNTLGEITAIRSWDRKTGRVLPPPASIPFTFRLERDHLRLNHSEHQKFQKDWFGESSDREEVRIQPGESLFPEEREEWKILSRFEMAWFFGDETRGEVNSAGFRDRDPGILRVQADLRPGRHPLEFEYLHHAFQSRFTTRAQVKNTLFPLGADVWGTFDHVTLKGRHNVFSRNDGQLELFGGLRITENQLKLRDGSRRVEWSQTSLAPVAGIRGVYLPMDNWKLKADAVLSRFRMSGVDTNSLEGGVEIRHDWFDAGPFQSKEWTVGLGYRVHDHKVYADRDTLTPVKIDQDFRGSYLSVDFRF